MKLLKYIKSSIKTLSFLVMLLCIVALDKRLVHAEELFDFGSIPEIGSENSSDAKIAVDIPFEEAEYKEESPQLEVVQTPEQSLKVAQSASEKTDNLPFEMSIFDTMHSVLNHSPSLKALEENRKTIYYEVWNARSGYFPSLDASGSIGYGRTEEPSNPDPDFAPTATASITLSQSIWNGFGTMNTVSSNKYKLESIDNRVFDNQTTLALEGLIAHLEVIRTKEALELTKVYIETHRTILKQLELLRASGMNTVADVTQTQGRLIRTLAEEENAINAHKLAVTNYELLTGHKPPQILLAGEFPSQALASVSEMQDFALKHNPKILALQADYNAANKQVNVARSNYLPKITATVSAEYSNDVLNADVSQAEKSLNATLGVSWNLFNGFGTVNSTRIAKAGQRMAQQDLQATTEAILSDVENTFNNLNNSKSLQSMYGEALLYNFATRDAYMRQFRFGSRPLIDLLDAESELYSTQIQLAITDANVILNNWRLLALQGKLMDELQTIEKAAKASDESVKADESAIINEIPDLSFDLPEDAEVMDGEEINIPEEVTDAQSETILKE